jgi:hypothetical protein
LTNQDYEWPLKHILHSIPVGLGESSSNQYCIRLSHCIIVSLEVLFEPRKFMTENQVSTWLIWQELLILSGFVVANFSFLSQLVGGDREKHQLEN